MTSTWGAGFRFRRGQPFESTGGAGVHWGSGVTPIGSFAHVGHFGTGGMVPGYRGQAQLAVVHGGEQVSTPTTMDQVVQRLDRLIAAVEKVAPGVGAEINQTGRSMFKKLRGCPNVFKIVFKKLSSRVRHTR